LSKQKTFSAVINILLFPSRKKTKTVYDFHFAVQPIAMVFYKKEVVVNFLNPLHPEVRLYTKIHLG